MPRFYFFNPPKSNDSVRITPLFTRSSQIFTTEDSDSACLTGQTPAPVFFSYDYQYEYSRNNGADTYNRGLPLFMFDYANNGLFSSFSNLGEFGNRLFNIIALPIAGLQLVIHHMLDAIQAAVSLDVGKSLLHMGIAICAVLLTTVLTAWELFATTIRIIPSAGNLLTMCPLLTANTDEMSDMEPRIGMTF
jgi:hypothetical protein